MRVYPSVSPSAYGADTGELQWQWIIKPDAYEDIAFVAEDRIAVKDQSGKYALTNMQGELLTAFRYDSIDCYREGIAAVKKADYRDGLDAWAYIDRQGRTAIDFYPYDAAGDSFYSVGKFQNGYAFVSKTLCVVIDEEGNDVFRDSYFFISAPWYNPEYNVIPGYVYTDPEMTVRKYGMAGINGEQRIEPVFDGIDSMSGKYIIVSGYRDGRLRKGLIEVGMPDKGRLTVGGSGTIIASFPRS